jgi:Predicted transcriptional regulators
MDELQSFAARLDRAMKLKGISGGMLAIKSGMSDRMVRNYLKGKFRPSADSVKKLAGALGVSIDWLMGTEEDGDD